MKHEKYSITEKLQRDRDKEVYIKDACLRYCSYQGKWKGKDLHAERLYKKVNE